MARDQSSRLLDVSELLSPVQHLTSDFFYTVCTWHAEREGGSIDTDTVQYLSSAEAYMHTVDISLRSEI